MWKVERTLSMLERGELVMTEDAAEAAHALAAMQASQARLASAARCPPERHLAFAAIVAAYVACPALPFVAMMGAEAVLLLVVATVVRWDKRRTGMFINGYRPGKTRPVMLAVLACVLGLYVASYWLARMRGVVWAPLALAPVGGLIAWLGSAQWQRIYLRELGANR